MDSALRKNYKAGATTEVTDARRRRNERFNSIRKGQRDDQLLKRRCFNFDDSEANSPAANELSEPVFPSNSNPSETSTGNASSGSSNKSKRITIDQLSGFAEQIVNGTDGETVLAAVHGIRKWLSSSSSPNIDAVLALNIVPHLVHFLGNFEMPDLQFEAAWALTNITSGTSEQTMAAVSSGCIPSFIQLLSSPSQEVQSQVIWALGNIAGDGPTLRDAVISEGVIPLLLQILDREQSVATTRNIVWMLSNLCRGKKPAPNYKLLMPSLNYIFHYYSTSKDAAILSDACWALAYLTDGPDEVVAALSKFDILPRAVSLLSHDSASVVTPALRILGNFTVVGEAETQSALDNGVLPSVRHILVHGSQSLQKECCWLISNITAGTVPQIQAVIDANMIPPVLNIASKGDARSKREAGYALANLVLGGTQAQVKQVVSQGCVSPLCDLLKSSTDVKYILTLLDAFGTLLSVGSKIDRKISGSDNPYADFVEEAGGVDTINHLQMHESEAIYKKCAFIISTYFGGEEENENVSSNIAPQIQSGGAYGFGLQNTFQQQNQSLNF